MNERNEMTRIQSRSSGSGSGGAGFDGLLTSSRPASVALLPFGAGLGGLDSGASLAASVAASFSAVGVRRS